MNQDRTVDAECDLVEDMRVRMRRVLALPKNRARGHWSKVQIGTLLSMLEGEVDELARAAKARECPERVMDEAADVANVAAMIASNYRERFPGMKRA